MYKAIQKEGTTNYISARVGLFRGTAQTVTVRRTQARSALHAAKHTHRHRTPSLVGLSVYLDFKGMGPTVT